LEKPVKRKNENLFRLSAQIMFYFRFAFAVNGWFSFRWKSDWDLRREISIKVTSLKTNHLLFGAPRFTFNTLCDSLYKS
jgi:hypothetical protein